MVKIHAPNKNYSGVTATVPFVKGEGETNDTNLIDWFRMNGYTVDEPAAPDPEITPPENGEPPANGDTKKSAGDKKKDGQ